MEYGLTDIQEYYANTGALSAAAQSAKAGGLLWGMVLQAPGPGITCSTGLRSSAASSLHCARCLQQPAACKLS